jgi:hypothetical protein
MVQRVEIFLSSILLSLFSFLEYVKKKQKKKIYTRYSHHSPKTRFVDDNSILIEKKQTGMRGFLG